jgi:hypothetical protein
MNRVLTMMLGIGLAGPGTVDLARAACEGAGVQFAEDFSRPNPSWSPLSNEVFHDGKYVMTVEPNGIVSDWPSAVRFSGSYTVCVRLALPVDPNGAAGSGVLFWIDPDKNSQGGHNYYMAMVSPDGFFWVSRAFNGERSNVVEPAQSDLLKSGPNVANEIAVTLRDNHGVLIINGKEAGEFTGQAPSQSYAGILAGAPLDKRYRVEFSNFRVVKP